jgi:hypothetical protein
MALEDPPDVVGDLASHLLVLTDGNDVIEPIVLLRGGVEDGSHPPVQPICPGPKHARVGHIDDLSIIGFQSDADVEAAVARHPGNPVRSTGVHRPRDAWSAESPAGHRRDTDMAGIQLVVYVEQQLEEKFRFERARWRLGGDRTDGSCRRCQEGQGAR